MASEALDDNAMLSHYTSEQGLLGIVRSQSLWATDCLALEDKTEFTFALSAIYESAIQIALPRVPAELRDESKEKIFFTSIRQKLFDDIRKQAANGDGYGNIYVTTAVRLKSEQFQLVNYLRPI